MKFTNISIILFFFASSVYAKRDYVGVDMNFGFSSYSYWFPDQDEYDKNVLPRINRGIGIKRLSFLDENNKFSFSYAAKYDTRGFFLELAVPNTGDEGIKDKYIYKFLDFPITMKMHSGNPLHLFRHRNIPNIFESESIQGSFIEFGLVPSIPISVMIEDQETGKMYDVSSNHLPLDFSILIGGGLSYKINKGNQLLLVKTNLRQSLLNFDKSNAFENLSINATILEASIVILFSTSKI